MKLVVIGGAGRMGSWFARYFREKGHAVTIFDADKDAASRTAQELGVSYSPSDTQAAADADVTMLAIPLNVIPEVVERLSHTIRKGATLIEIGSLKQISRPSILRASQLPISILSLHPLFGGEAGSMAGKRVALVPVRDAKMEVELASNLLPDAKIVVVDADRHDRAMAFILSLPHFTSLVFAGSIAEGELDYLMGLAGPTFLSHLLLAGTVLQEDPKVYASIQMLNPHSLWALDRMLTKASELKEAISKASQEDFVRVFSSTALTILPAVSSLDPARRIVRMLEGPLP